MQLNSITEKDILPADVFLQLAKKDFEILLFLQRNGAMNCTAIAASTHRRLDAVSHNLKTLGDLGLIHRNKQGRVVENSLTRDFLLFDLTK